MPKREIKRPGNRTLADVQREVLERLEAGERPSQICDGLEGRPASTSTLFRWVSDGEEFAAEYARAREIGYSKMADEILDIADDKTGDSQRDRLRVDTRKWLLSKVLPKIYGERLAVSGPDGGPLEFTFVLDHASRGDAPEG